MLAYLRKRPEEAQVGENEVKDIPRGGRGQVTKGFLCWVRSWEFILRVLGNHSRVFFFFLYVQWGMCVGGYRNSN